MEGEETAGGAAESRGEPVAASRSKHCVAVPVPALLAPALLAPWLGLGLEP